MPTEPEKIIPEIIPAAPVCSAFASWRTAMGFNGKQVAEAGARVGLNASEAGRRNRGEVDLSQLELMGLTAAWLGLPAWSPDLPARLDQRAGTMLRLAAEDVARCLKDQA